MVALKKEIKRTCEICGNTFIAKTITSRYCSRYCTNVAYKQRKKLKLEKERKEKIAEAIPEDQVFITVPQALSLYSVSRNTLYKYIREGHISSINFGQRLTRINRKELEELFSLKINPQPKSQKKLYSLEPEDCYTIGEIAKKYHIHEDTVSAHIRRFSIPTRQIGNYVYAPKSEIDKIYKSL